MITPHTTHSGRSSLIATLALLLAVGFAAFAWHPATANAREYVVVIDAGHQAKANLTLEPIGPGSTTRKPSVSAGTRGIATRRAESSVNLQVALKLRDMLRARGVKVIMVRTTQSVNIANSKRAAIANNANADLFIRLHCDGSTNHRVKGFLTLVPGKNRWTGPIVSPSAIAGKKIHSAVIAATGARNRGITPRTDMAGFNWSKVPAVIVEMGLMSNYSEDRALSSSAYQKKLATGMTDGIMAYLATR